MSFDDWSLIDKENAMLHGIELRDGFPCPHGWNDAVSALMSECKSTYNGIYTDIDDLKRSAISTRSMGLDLIQKIVQAGEAEKYFNYGDQILVNWSDGSTDYEVPCDVVEMGNYTFEDDSVGPGLCIQWHYTTPMGIPFDANEAFFYTAEGLTAGTYHFIAANGWGSKSIVAGQSYQFTLTSAVPAGGQLVLTTGMVDHDLTDVKVSSFESATATTAIESGLALTVGTDGTDLGSLVDSENPAKWSSSQVYNNDYAVTGFNHMHRSNYGYNRHSQSFMRQWLNASGAAGTYFVAQNKFDRPPSEATSLRGFMAGFSSEFLNVVKKVKQVTRVNQVEGLASDLTDVTCDKFWLPSLEQEYVEPYLSGEGPYFPYYKAVKGLDKPQVKYQNFALAKKYAINAKTSAQYYWFRSALSGVAHGAAICNPSGNANTSNSTNTLHAAPACVIG